MGDFDITAATEAIKSAFRDERGRGYDEGFRAGYDKARAEMLALLSSGGAISSISSATEVPEKDDQQIERQRAPKGTVKALVIHALTVSPGLTPHEILNHARNSFERMVKLASVRSELNKSDDYCLKDGKWFLSDEIEAEGADFNARPSASTDDYIGGDPDAAALI